MNMALFQEIKQLLSDRFLINPSKIGLSSDLQKELNLDSLDAVDLLMAINEAFQIRIPQETLDSIHTVSDLVSVVERYSSKIK
jgi:acyl carrier protein